MIIKKLTRSFAGGEITPEMYARLDLTKFQTGLALCRNFEVLPHGPVQNRAGLEYTLEVKDSSKRTRLIPFSFNTQQTFALEVGDQFIRFHTNGGTLLEAAKAITGITQANPGVITIPAHGYANGDWLFLANIGGMTALNGRWVKAAGVTANTFQLTSVHGGANIDTTALPAWTAGGTAARVYEVATPYLEADLFDLHYTQSADVETVVHPTYAPRELRRLGATNWTLTSILFAPTIATPTAPTATAGGPGGGTPVTLTYVCTAVATEGLEESYASPAATANSDLTVVGNYVDVTPAAVAGAVRYNVYKLKNGLYGYIGQTDGSALRDSNITPDATKTPPLVNDPFASAGNYPQAVGYYEGRRIFGGTTNKPQNIWMTRSGTESNLTYSIPTRDDDGIFFRIAARDVNSIRHILPLSSLVLLTAGGEWKVEPRNSDILTPTSASPRQSASEGANNVQPVITSSALLYAQARGGRVREMKYDWNSQDYTSEDLSILAPHLFDGFTIVDMAYAKAPTRTIWAVRSDGTLLGLTYLPKQEVAAWHQHTTDGFFESVCVVAEGNEDVLYCIVRRTVNGRTVRNVERKRGRQFANLAASFIVDSGLTYSGAAANTVSGLYHLEGKTVVILADGAVMPQQVVTAGRITLPNSITASVIQIGLPYVSDLQTLPIALEAVQQFGQNSFKNVNEVGLRVYKSSGVFAGPSFDQLKEVKQRTTEPFGTPPQLITEMVRLTISPDWSDNDAPICVRQSAPLPLTLEAIVAEVALGG